MYYGAKSKLVLPYIRVDLGNAGQDEERVITLNIWDFEGQEINHQSHQFFLTQRSLYVLVVNGRREIRMNRIEYWLDTIRARAPGCKVLLVATECEDRTPTLDVARLRERYGLLLAPDPLYMVGCQNDRNIPELRTELGRLATELELVPTEWPGSYKRVEAGIERLKGDIAYMDGLRHI